MLEASQESGTDTYFGSFSMLLLAMFLLAILMGVGKALDTQLPANKVPAQEPR